MIARARAAGVAGFLTIGTDEATSVAAVALAAAEPDVYAAVGIHPHDAGTADPATLERIAALARAPRVVAIGEIGLDYFRDLSPRAASGRRSSPSSAWRGPSGSPCCSIAGRRTRTSSTSARPRGSPPSAGSCTASRATSRWRAAASTSGS